MCRVDPQDGTRRFDGHVSRDNIVCISFHAQGKYLIALNERGDIYRRRIEGDGPFLPTEILSPEGWRRADTIRSQG
jgi:hypothetical protein